MIKCKICESEILGEKLKDHSIKCKDVTELKEKLLVFINRMEDFAEKASAMKNSLETYAAKQKYLKINLLIDLYRKVNKKLSRSNSINVSIDPGSPASFKDSKDGKDSAPSLSSVSIYVMYFWVYGVFLCGGSAL